MDKYAKAFVKSSLIYLGVGVVTGLLILTHPDLRYMLTRVHTHINLLGFMAMMIYGVGYHILPRFMGRPVYSHRLGTIQVWLANISLTGLSLFWVLESVLGEIGQTLAILSGLAHGISIFIFIFNLWRSMGSTKSSER